MRADVRLREIVAAEDPALGELSVLLARTFADPNVVLSADRLRTFLRDNRADGPREFCVLVAESTAPASRLRGGTVFSYVPAAGCGFSEYLVVDAARRGEGLGRRLVEARTARLDTAARAAGLPAAHGTFIETDDPRRIPAELARLERQTAMDPVARVRLFAHLGFRLVDVPYVQPPLGPGQAAVDYLQLLFAPAAPDRQELPTEWLLATLEPIWTAWAPDTAAAQLARLRVSLTTPTLVLRDPRRDLT
jgi:GNAT superfamily N-acetyltransferase